MLAARQLQQRRCGSCVRLALVACLLALSQGADAQLFELLTAPTAPTVVTPASPAIVTPASPAPAVVTPSPTPTASPAVVTPASPAPAVVTPSPTPAATPTAAPVAAAPAAAVGTPSAEAPSFGVLPGATPTPAGNATVPGANVTAGTPPVNMTVGGDAAPVSTGGTVDQLVPAPPADVLPPAPPEGWQALQKDCQIVINIEIRGPYIFPFTKPKGTVIARVLRDRYLRSAQIPDIQVDAIRTFTFPSDDSPKSADPVPTGSRRLFASRDLLQITKSGAELRIVVATNSERVPSEIASIEEGVASGLMADDFTIAGIVTDNITLSVSPQVEDLIGPGTQESSQDGGFKAWIIAVIVGGILLLVPIPAFFIIRWRKRRNKEESAVQAAETEAARLRMQSRVVRPGSKSFSLKPGGSSADIMVMTGSMGGLAGFHNNGRLQSWSDSPERYGQQYNGSVSRAASVTSMGSALPPARAASYGMPQRVPSLPGQGRGQYAGPMMPPPGAYEEELHTARSVRSQQQ